MLAAASTLHGGSRCDDLPQASAVYLIRPKQGRPLLGRTSILRRRVSRLFEKLNLRELSPRVDYWLTGSKLEQEILSYALAREVFPDDWERVYRLPRPAFVKLVMSNQFPRTMITSRVSGGKSIYFGPFPTRAAADQFDAQFLDLFQLRRCQEDLVVSPDHPGCIYGEMGRCSRPCQELVSVQEYATEAARVGEFLSTRGKTMLDAAAAARLRCSSDLQFEEASRQHARIERIEQILKLAGDLASEVSTLHGVAITKSSKPDMITLWFFLEGCWMPPLEFSISPNEMEPLDPRLRAVVDGLGRPNVRERPDHLALLAKWYFSSWRDGEWLPFRSLKDLSYRKLVNAIHRVATG